MRALLVEEISNTYLQIYKNIKPDIYNYTVLKGDNLYFVNIEFGKKMIWKYEGKIDKKTYNINGILIKEPSKKMIIILQKVLKPKENN